MIENNESTHIELSRDHFIRNIDFIRSQLKPGTTLSAVVKGNAYGHGTEFFVPMCEEQGINHFSVYGIEEARQFFQHASSESSLMIMGFIHPDQLKWVLDRGYEFFVYDVNQLKTVLQISQAKQIPPRIHLEFETGMNRTGFTEEDYAELIQILLSHQGQYTLMGACTHLAGAESYVNFERVKGQITKFKEVLKHFSSAGFNFEYKHVSCSAAMMRFPDAHFNMVRIGIMLYGFWPNQETLGDFMATYDGTEDPLHSILSWKTQIMAVKTVKAGEYIGYGTTFLANIETKIALIPVGYAHGYSRSLSNQGRVLVHGVRVPVIGLVNMNMLTIDVSELEEVSIGDEVTLIGTQGDQRITVSSFGELSAQLNYELLTRLPRSISRKIVDYGIR